MLEERSSAELEVASRDVLLAMIQGPVLNIPEINAFCDGLNLVAANQHKLEQVS